MMRKSYFLQKCTPALLWMLTKLFTDLILEKCVETKWLKQAQLLLEGSLSIVKTDFNSVKGKWTSGFSPFTNKDYLPITITLIVREAISTEASVAFC